MKSNVKKWFGCALALLIAFPGLAYPHLELTGEQIHEAAQKQLHDKIEGLLNQGKIEQAEQWLNSIPSCPPEGTVYEKETDVWPYCGYDKRYYVVVTIKHPTRDGFDKEQIIPMVDVDAERAKIAEKRAEQTRIEEESRRIQFLLKELAGADRSFFSQAEQTLINKLSSALQNSGKEAAEKVWNSIPACSDIEGWEYTDAQVPDLCRGYYPVTVTVHLAEDSSYTGEQQIQYIPEGKNWDMRLFSLVYKSLFGKPINEYNLQRYLSFLKKYKGTELYEAVDAVLFSYVSDTYCKRYDFWDFKEKAQDIGRCFYYKMSWGTARGLTPEQSCNDRQYLAYYMYPTILQFAFLNSGNNRYDKPFLCVIGEKEEREMFSAFYSEAKKNNNVGLFHQFKQHIFFQAFAGVEGEATDRKIGSLSQKSVWEVLAIQMPSDKKKEMQEFIVREMMPRCMNELKQQGTNYAWEPRCRAFRNNAKEYGFWTDDAERIYQEAELIYDEGLNPVTGRVKRGVKQAVEQLGISAPNMYD